MLIYFGYHYIQNYIQIETITIVIVFEKNRLELDRLNEKKERFILILFKHDPLYNVSQGKKNVYHDSLF